MSEVNLDRKNWLVPFIREATARFDVEAARARLARYMGPAAAASVDDGAPEHWRTESLRRRGILNGPLQRLWPEPEDGLKEKERGEWHFLNALSHQLEVLYELRLLLGRTIHTVSDQLEVLSVMSAQVGDYEASETLYELRLESWEERPEALAKALRDPARSAGKSLKETSLLDYDQPLLGLPFHFILVYVQTLQMIQIGWRSFRGDRRVDMQDAEQVRAAASMQKIYLVEAIIAMAQADHRITKVEKRLIENVIDLVRLSDEDEEMLWAELDSVIDVGELGHRITDPLTKRFIFVQVVVHSLLEGAQDMMEHTFIETFGIALGLSEEQRMRYEAEAYAFLERNPELVDAFQLSGIFRRFRNHLSSRFESLVTANISKIATEIRETGELAKLLAKNAAGELSPEESERMKNQLGDVLKSIPALGLFVVPGGSVLLPLVIKLLPFDILPSAFNEEDETLDREDLPD